MKKLISILGIMGLVWVVSYVQQNDVPRKAWAGLTCSLPIILTNGTTADAGQVMQNFNALSACFLNVATVSQVTCGPGLDGGVITGIGTCSLSAARRTNPTQQILTGGTGTYTLPANALWIEVSMVGGGGAGGSNTNAGSAGLATTFGASASAGGGGGGSGANNTPGSGGTPTSCAANPVGYGIAGGDGSVGPAAPAGGTGGNSFFGGGGRGGVSGAGAAGKANTGGGGGGDDTGGAGFGGGGSGAYCYLLISNPPASIAFTVGAGGTSPATGGPGGSGIIVVTEHYN